MQETVWAFDLGIASIGEAVRKGNQFLHKASLLIPPEFASTKDATKRRRAWRTRQAHKAREEWLREVMQKVGIEVLHGKQVTWNEKEKKWDVTSGDERLEREFAKPGDPTCYTSCLLRIKLLRGEKLEPWQIYKALHSAIQKRGYGKVPWAAKEAARHGLTSEELEKREKTELEKKDPTYQAAVNAWRAFKKNIQQIKLPLVEKLQPSKAERQKYNLTEDFYFVPPSFYDAVKMKLWDPAEPDAQNKGMTHNASSTRKVRFDRDDVEKEIEKLARQAVEQLPQIKEAFETIKANGWTQRNNKTKREKHFEVTANDFAEFLVHGPTGRPPEDTKEDFGKYRAFRKSRDIHPGSPDDWMGATAQKIPRFDNRIIEKCALIPRLNVCRAGAKAGIENPSLPEPDSLLHTQVAFLLKLKNVRVLRAGKVESLTAKQIKLLFDKKKNELSRLSLEQDDPKYAEKVAKIFSFEGKTAWANVGEESDFNFRPYVNHEEIEAPKNGGRSRFSRPALKILRELILSGEAPSAFHKRLLASEKKDGKFVFHSLSISEDSSDDAINKANKKKGLLVSELEFLNKMRKVDATEDSWDDIFIPNEKLDGIVLQLQNEPDAANQRQKRNAAILKLIGSQNDPIVRHRLKFFWERLQTIETLPDIDGKPIGKPARVILEFAREDFLGKKAKDRWKDFNKKKREQNRNAREQAANERETLKIKLRDDQGGECIYGKLLPNGTVHRGLPLPGEDKWDQLEIDHIVPRDMGGPNAYINYVLTWGEVANQQKRDRIPYVWFSQDRPNQLDGYINFVKSKKATKEKPGLSSKKIALLTRPDAAELVERYTALAQTAWIARLAQTIVRLHFGWPLDHQKGEERVLTLTGGQTAQFRREFRLNSLLGENAKSTASASDISKREEEEIAAKIQDDLINEKTKNRVDPRHHALDAMVLALIPEWRHHEAKKWAKWRGKFLDEKRKLEILNRPTPFFDSPALQQNGKLNKNSVRQLFAKMLEETHAKFVAFEPPKLEETHYSKTTQQLEKNIRKSLDEIAYNNSTDLTNRKFDEAKLRRWIKRCLDKNQKESLRKFAEANPSMESWEAFKKANKKLFPSAKVKVIAPQPVSQYTIRKELRLLAYENNKDKAEWIFKPEWAQQAAGEIEANTQVLRTIKVEIENYLKEHTEITHKEFATWLKSRCDTHSLKKLSLCPLADESDEADSKRRTRSVSPDNFGCIKIPLVFKPERLLKTYNKIFDPFIRSAIAEEFKIEGEGKKIKCRTFTREEWETFCSNLRKPTKKKDGNGPRILKVTLTAGSSDEDPEDDEIITKETDYNNKNSSKDEFVPSTKTPRAYMKGKAHKGYYVFLDRHGHWQRIPVFVHQNHFLAKKEYEKIKRQEQAASNSKFKEIGFLQTGTNIFRRGLCPAYQLRLHLLIKSFKAYQLNIFRQSYSN